MPRAGVLGGSGGRAGAGGNVSIAAVHADENALAPRNSRSPRRGGAAAGYVDGSPSKGRVRKAARPDGAAGAANPLFTRPRDDVYETVVERASKLFAVIRQTVVCELAPSALKSAFLDPLHASLFNEVRPRCTLSRASATLCRSCEDASCRGRGEVAAAARRCSSHFLRATTSTS